MLDMAYYLQGTSAMSKPRCLRLSAVLLGSMMLGTVSLANLTGRYVWADNTGLVHLSVTQTSDRADGVLQFFWADLTSSNGYRTSSHQVSGTVDGKKFVLKEFLGSLYQGEAVSGGIKIQFPSNGGESFTASLKSTSEATWNKTLAEFKKEKGESALAHQFGTALARRMEWLDGQYKSLTRRMVNEQNKIEELQTKLKEYEDDLANVQVELEYAESELKKATEALKQAEEEVRKAEEEERKNSTPETREAARLARYKSSDAWSALNSAEYNLYSPERRISSLTDRIAWVREDIDECLRSIVEAQKNLTLRIEEMQIFAQESSIEHIQKLLAGNLSVCKIQKARIAYPHPNDTFYDPISTRNDGFMYVLPLNSKWVPTILVNRDIGWVKG